MTKYQMKRATTWQSTKEILEIGIEKSHQWARKGVNPSSESLAYEHFNRGKQLRQMMVLALLRWAMTATLVSSIYGVLISYSQREAMPTRKKSEFNALVIGLSIALGLNIASSLKADVGRLRWWLLSLAEYDPRESDLILQSENLSRLVLLGIKSRRWSIHLFVAVFVILNVASQVALALLGITYNINPADKFTVTVPGKVVIPDLSDVQTDKVLARNYTAPQALNSRRYAANSFGLVSLAWGEASIENVPQPGTLYNPDHAMIFYNDTDVSYTYYFYEATPPSSSYFAMTSTDRYFSVSTSCERFQVVKGGDGLNNTFTMKAENGTLIENMIPITNGPDQTTFLNDPAAADTGDTWAIVEAFEASKTSPWFYSCNVSIGPVINAKIKEHLIGVNISKFAAPSIALQGYGSSVNGVVNETAILYQFQSYPAESNFGTPAAGNSSLMGRIMSRFAVGSVAVTGQSNTNVEAEGMVPTRAITLEINRWGYVHMILGLTMGIQLLIAVVSTLVANRVQVRGHSHLAMAALLRPTIRGVNDSAISATGNQIADMLGKDVRLTYVTKGGGGYHVRTNQL